MPCPNKNLYCVFSAGASKSSQSLTETGTGWVGLLGWAMANC